MPRQFSLYLDKDFETALLPQLEKLAAAEDRAVSWIIKQAVQYYLAGLKTGEIGVRFQAGKERKK